MANKRTLPRWFHDFIHAESSSGIVMLLCAALAIALSNSPFADSYDTSIAPVKHWVKDVLMVVFFFLVGLELKREIRQGFLKERDQLLLPLIAAIAGMAIPALTFFAINYPHPENYAGWAIASATDIAFALCVLMLVSKSLPPALKIFLLAVAIFDDLGAILIIALFYSQALSLIPLILALVAIGALWLLNRQNVNSIWLYALIGIFLWFCFHYAGIHTTVAGVVLGLGIPMEKNASLIKRLHPWVAYLILPVFAFVSAGIRFDAIAISDLLHPLPLGIALGLFLGKQLGIFSVVILLVKTGLASKPANTNWLQLYGVSVIAGIGFTMSLFIGLLAFTDTAQQELVKIGVIGGSLLSALWGAAILKYSLRVK